MSYYFHIISYLWVHIKYMCMCKRRHLEYARWLLLLLGLGSERCFSPLIGFLTPSQGIKLTQIFYVQNMVDMQAFCLYKMQLMALSCFLQHWQRKYEKTFVKSFIAYPSRTYSPCKGEQFLSIFLIITTTKSVDLIKHY